MPRSWEGGSIRFGWIAKCTEMRSETLPIREAATGKSIGKLKRRIIGNEAVWADTTVTYAVFHMPSSFKEGKDGFSKVGNSRNTRVCSVMVDRRCTKCETGTLIKFRWGIGIGCEIKLGMPNPA
jgi:hypothetical protein